MQGIFTVYCLGCKKRLAQYEHFDTADDSGELGYRVQKLLLDHRGECRLGVTRAQHINEVNALRSQNKLK